MILKSFLRNSVFCFLYEWTEGTSAEHPHKIAYIEEKLFQKINCLPIYLKFLFTIVAIMIQIRMFFLALSTSHVTDLKQRYRVLVSFNSRPFFISKNCLKFIFVFSTFYWLALEETENQS